MNMIETGLASRGMKHDRKQFRRHTIVRHGRKPPSADKSAAEIGQ
jgi:hypothetical protein